MSKKEVKRAVAKVVPNAHVNAVLKKVVDNQLDPQSIACMGKVEYRKVIDARLVEERGVLKKLQTQLAEKKAAITAAVEQQVRDADAGKSQAVTSSLTAYGLKINVAFENTLRRENGVLTIITDISWRAEGNRGYNQLGTQITTLASSTLMAFVADRDALQKDLEAVQGVIKELEYTRVAKLGEFEEELTAGIYSKHLASIPDGADVVALVQEVVSRRFKADMAGIAKKALPSS